MYARNRLKPQNKDITLGRTRVKENIIKSIKKRIKCKRTLLLNDTTKTRRSRVIQTLVSLICLNKHSLWNKQTRGRAHTSYRLAKHCSLIGESIVLSTVWSSDVPLQFFRDLNVLWYQKYWLIGSAIVIFVIEKGTTVYALR